MQNQAVPNQALISFLISYQSTTKKKKSAMNQTTDKSIKSRSNQAPISFLVGFHVFFCKQLPKIHILISNKKQG